MLDQLRHDALAGNQVGHGHMGHFHNAFGDHPRKGRHPVNDHKRIADEGRLDGGRAAGHHRGAGVEKRSAGVVDEADSQAAAETLAQALQMLPQGVLVLGLILKVEKQADQEKIVNWEFAAPETLKSLALVLPGETSQPCKE